ncbi:MAG: CRISPR-associated protein Cas4 [Anaerolineae bacterium]|nr:CRISPR-associated protein Cas4 [Anaerolineae bacterium]
MKNEWAGADVERWDSAWDEVPWRVTDLKQYFYCARVLYYHACLPRVRPTTYKMEASASAHVEAQAREERRSLRTFGLTRGERHFGVPLVSERLGLRGEVDLVIETDETGDKEAIPVDYKLSTRAGTHFQLQLVAYGVMLEESWGVPVRRGFLYSIPQRKAEEVRITQARRTALDEALHMMHGILLREEMPPPTTHRARCVACEFRRFCNDVT